MRQSNYLVAVTAAALLFSRSIYAQISLPPCISKCIDQSTDDSCKITDIKCICRESNGRFLPDVILCMHGACDSTLDVNSLLTPLSLACDVAGTPISPSALANAQLQASSIATEGTVTVTKIGTVTNFAPTPVGPATAPASGNSENGGVVTVTQIAPLQSTTSQLVSGTTYTGYVTVIIVGTNGGGSIYTSTTTVPGTVSTITTTNSAGSTQTMVSTYTQNITGVGGGIGGIIVQTITTTNSVGSTFTTTQSSTQTSGAASGTGVGVGAGAGGSASSSSMGRASSSPSSSSSSSSTASKASSGAPSEVTDSSPFATQSTAGQDRLGSCLALSVLLVFIGLWL